MTRGTLSKCPVVSQQVAEFRLEQKKHSEGVVEATKAASTKDGVSCFKIVTDARICSYSAGLDSHRKGTLQMNSQSIHNNKCKVNRHII